MAKLPPYAKGELRECAYCGFWYPERDRRIRRRDGKWVCIWDDDSLTEEQRAKSIKV